MGGGAALGQTVLFYDVFVCLVREKILITLQISCAVTVWRIGVSARLDDAQTGAGTLTQRHADLLGISAQRVESRPPPLPYAIAFAQSRLRIKVGEAQ